MRIRRHEVNGPHDLFLQAVKCSIHMAMILNNQRIRVFGMHRYHKSPGNRIAGLFPVDTFYCRINAASAMVRGEIVNNSRGIDMHGLGKVIRIAHNKSRHRSLLFF